MTYGDQAAFGAHATIVLRRLVAAARCAATPDHPQFGAIENHLNLAIDAIEAMERLLDPGRSTATPEVAIPDPAIGRERHP